MTPAPLVLLHGFPLQSSMWDPALSLLRDAGLDCHAWNLPGFGSEPWPEQLPDSIAALADWVAGRLDAQGIEGPVQLAGLSMGGYIALEFADRHPHRLDRMILCDTKATADPPAARQQRLQMVRQMKAVKDRENTVEGEDPRPGLADAMLPKLLSPHSLTHRHEVVRQARGMVMNTPCDTIARAQSAMAARRDTTETLRRCEVPVLCIVGQDDALTPPEVMQAMSVAARQGRCEVIANAGHLAPLEDPQRFAEIVLQGLPQA